MTRRCGSGAGRPVDTTISTSAYGQGPVSLVINGWDAAGRTTTATKTLYVDNSTPTLSLSGPTNAPSTAGTQYVTATAGGSPSGIDGVSCSVDGGPAHWYPGAVGQVAVSGIGEHTVRCDALDNAVDQYGTHAQSPTRTWSLKIGQPTMIAAGFLRYVGLRCHKAHERVRVPGHWVPRRWHGRKVKIKTHPRHKTITVTKCSPKIKRVRVVVRVPVRRHGKIVRRHGKIVTRKRVEHRKVAVTPHWTSRHRLHVAHGHATTVSGWLATTNATALPGRTVRVLSAPDNGLDHLTVIATTKTAANGSWSASIPAGPSRIIEAAYSGDATTEASISTEIKEIVPSKIKLVSVTPTRVAWGHTVEIKGELLGGHLPPGGVNVRLRIGLGKDRVTYGVQEHVSGNGRFATSYTFGLGTAADPPPLLVCGRDAAIRQLPLRPIGLQPGPRQRRRPAHHPPPPGLTNTRGRFAVRRRAWQEGVDGRGRDQPFPKDASPDRLRGRETGLPARPPNSQGRPDGPR